MHRPLSSSSIVTLPLTLLLLVQLSVIPVAAQIQAPSCLSAALGVWNWVRISSSVPIDELISSDGTLADIQQPQPSPLRDSCLSRSRMLQWTCVPSVLRTFVETSIDAFAEFTIEALPQGQFYTGPSGSDDCRCNSVYYSLISGCAGCQKGTWLPYVRVLLLGTPSCLESW
jgi:hypothetical protein